MIRWIPPFVIGLAAATAGEVAVGLLLYSGEGWRRALTIILATEIGALGLGLMAAPDLNHPNLVDALRRRWMVCLMVFMVAAGFATLWTLRPGAAATAVSQALGRSIRHPFADHYQQRFAAVTGTRRQLTAIQGLRAPWFRLAAAESAPSA